MTVYIGIDWSEQKHDVVFLNEAGAEIAYTCIPHTLEGFVMLERQRAKLGLAVSECLIGMETSHSLLLDHLLGQHYAVYVLPPNQVRANQGRFRQSGARDDPADARLIADILRTDHGRLRPWQSDGFLTQQLRVRVRWILELNHQIQRLANQLRALLLRYYPVALGVFRSGLTSQIAPAFIETYPDPDSARELSLAEFQAFAKQHHYPQPERLSACYARLQAQDYPPTPPDVALLYRWQAQQLAHLLLETIQTRVQTLAEVQRLYRQHPNYAVFASLPKAGELIGPALLAFFGDHLERFPSPNSVQIQAGTAPITERSGKYHFVRFRRTCDKDWRYICQEWAAALVGNDASPIALAYYDQVHARGHSQSHALRCVANRWLAVAWKLWQTGQPYDPAYHLKQRTDRCQPH